MSFFISLLTFALIAYYVSIRRVPGWRKVSAYLIATTAVTAFWSGFYLAVQEDARSRYGQVTDGVVVEKINSLGIQGARTIGLHSRDIRTGDGTRMYDMFARQLASGSPTAWVIDYSYDCHRPHPCWGRDFVRRDLWFNLRAGQQVPVRYVAEGMGGSRLENNPQMKVAFAEMGVGILIALAAAGVGGALPSLIRRRRRLQTTAIVTAVDQVEYLGMPRWRVRFTYLDDLGGSREGTDYFATNSWKPGDVGVADYEYANPDEVALKEACIETRASRVAHNSVSAG